MTMVVQNAIAKGVQFVFMEGKMPGMNRVLESLLDNELKDTNVRFINRYDETLSHLIFAASDVVLCHSYHDVSLQGPLKTLKYGAAPVLLTLNKDRFRHFSDHDQETPKFSKFMSSTFGHMSLSHAIDEIKTNPSKWNQTIRDTMLMDFSWDGECYDVHAAAYTAIKNL